MTQAPKARFSICLLEDEQNRLLFLRRSDEEKFGARQWGFPAGHIEVGETALEAATRELNEEIGEQHTLQAIAQLGPMRDSFYGGHYEIHLFHYYWLDGTVELNEEHTAYRWIEQSNFHELDVVLGSEEDIVLLNIWPASLFDPTRLP